MPEACASNSVSVCVCMFLLLAYEHDKDSSLGFSTGRSGQRATRERNEYYSHIKHCTNKTNKQINEQIKDRHMSLGFCNCFSTYPEMMSTGRIEGEQTFLFVSKIKVYSVLEHF